jgi:acetate kinase
MPGPSRILTLNAGSSSLKYALFERGTPPRRVRAGKVERVGLGADGHAQALASVMKDVLGDDGVASLAGVGHRIVHGGAAFDRPARVTGEMLTELRRLSVLDPDHLPAEIAIAEALAASAPSLPQVACFDTAFHRDLPRVARVLPIPRRFEASGVRRYGFHGLSYQFLLEELGRVAGQGAAHGRIVMAHLGSGASLAAVEGGRCLDTSMGFTPNSGVPMGTRSGDLDPGVVLHLLRGAAPPADRPAADALDDLLSRRSGLLGVSETSADMRDLLAREATDARAADAVALFCYSVQKAVGALAAALGGVDTLVFSGGIGENAPAVRARVAQRLGHLGVRLDEARNAQGAPVVSADDAACVVRVIRTDEEAVIARETQRVLDASPSANDPRRAP